MKLKTRLRIRSVIDFSVPYVVMQVAGRAYGIWWGLLAGAFVVAYGVFSFWDGITRD